MSIEPGIERGVNVFQNLFPAGNLLRQRRTRITDLLCLLPGVSFILAGFGGFLPYAPCSNWY